MIVFVNIAEATSGLLSGETVLLPTDTVYGLAAHPRSQKAVERIFALKRRPANVRLQVLIPAVPDLVASVDDTLGCKISQEAEILLSSPYIPGPLSLVLPLDPARKPEWLEGRDEVALRCPKDETIQAILKISGPLFATSANLHGETPSADVSAVCRDLNPEDRLLAVDGGTLSQTASTLVNLSTDVPTIDRIGAVSAPDIFAYLDMRRDRQ